MALSGNTANEMEKLLSILDLNNSSPQGNLIKIVQYLAQQQTMMVLSYEVCITVNKDGSPDDCFIIKQGSVQADLDPDVKFSQKQEYNENLMQSLGIPSKDILGLDTQNSIESKESESRSSYNKSSPVGAQPRPINPLQEEMTIPSSDLNTDHPNSYEDMDNQFEERMSPSSFSIKHMGEDRHPKNVDLADLTMDDEQQNSPKPSQNHEGVDSGTTSCAVADMPGAITDHDGHGDFKCSHCSQSFRQLLTLQVHELTHQPGPVKKPRRIAKKYQCPSCEFSVGAANDMILHLWEVHNNHTFFTCHPCKFICLSSDEHATHMSSENHKKNATVASKILELSANLCPLCGYVANNSFSLNAHLRVHVKKTDYCCTYCSFKCKTISVLRTHKMKKHKMNQKFHCKFCSFTTEYKDHYVRHIQRHTETEHKYKCRECESSFREMFQLKRHALYEHKSVDNFFCASCPFTCRDRKDYREHLQNHSGNDCYVCNTCSFTASNVRQLEVHMKSHSNHRPFKCSECDQLFRNQRSLKNHMGAKHSEERPYLCEECGFKAKLKKYMDRHIQMHFTAKSFACKLCDYTTKYRGNLRKHEATHSDDKPFNCSHCEYTSKSAEALRKHQKRMHKSSEN